jgi:hypothetical protein
MLKIRTAQEDALADEDFVRRVIVYLQTRVPASTAKLTHRQLRVVVRHGIRVAREHELRSERDLFAFTMDMLAVNPHFHRQREIHAALTHAGTPVEERMERATRQPQESWAEAGAMTDAAAYWTEVLAREDGGDP